MSCTARSVSMPLAFHNVAHLSNEKKTISGSVAHPGCSSRIPDPNFFHPWIRIRIFPIPDPGSASKNVSILNPKKLFPSPRKYDPGCSPRIRNLISYPFRITDPGVKKAPNPGSATLRIRTVNCKKRLYNSIGMQGQLPYLAVRTRLSQVRRLRPWWRPRAACWRPGGGTPGGAGASADRG